MAMWKDVSSFSQSNKDRVPWCFEAQFGRFRLVVHRHKDYPPDQWLATCYPGVFEHRELPSKDITEAKRQAATLLQVELQNALSQIASR